MTVISTGKINYFFLIYEAFTTICLRAAFSFDFESVHCLCIKIYIHCYSSFRYTHKPYIFIRQNMSPKHGR